MVCASIWEDKGYSTSLIFRQFGATQSPFKCAVSKCQCKFDVTCVCYCMVCASVPKDSPRALVSASLVLHRVLIIGVSFQSVN